MLDAAKGEFITFQADLYKYQETGGGGMGKGSHERENTLRPPHL